MKRILCVSLFVAAMALAAQTGSPWAGTWKLDRAKSHLTGSTYTVVQGANGMWVTTIGPITFTYAPDGKPYKFLDNDHTMLVTLKDPHTMKTINQVKGKTTSTSTDILSPDGNKISDVTVNVRPNGTTFTTTETDTRVGTGKGFLGTWISEKMASTSDTSQTITASSDKLTFADPAQKYTLTVKLDGTPAVPASPTIPAGVTMSYKKISPTRLDYAIMLNGQKVEEGYYELSASGRSYTDTNWLVGKESEKTVSVYNKL